MLVLLANTPSPEPVPKSHNPWGQAHPSPRDRLTEILESTHRDERILKVPTFGDRLHESSNLRVFRAESRGPGADAWRRSWFSTAGRAGFEAEVRIRFVVGLGSPAIWLGRVPWLLLVLVQ
jgi:hypothetical protein